MDHQDITARRFGGLERLYGVTGAKKIREAHIAVVGIGGVGSWAVEALARSGVGKLTLIITLTTCRCEQSCSIGKRL